MRRKAWLLALLLPVAAQAHDGPRAHTFLMTQVEILDSVLYFDVWVERPTPEVAAEFRSMFRDDPTRADEQDAAFLEFNFDRMKESISVQLAGEELALVFEPGPLVNNGRGNDEYFSWAIVASAPVPPSRRELDLRISNSLFEDAHVFLSCYVQVDGGWEVEFDSARASLDSASDPVPEDRAGVSWTHDPAVRDWEIRLRR